VMLSPENIVEQVFDNMPLPHFDSGARQRLRIELAGGAVRYRRASGDTRGSARTTGVAKRSPKRSGGSRCA